MLLSLQQRGGQPPAGNHPPQPSKVPGLKKPGGQVGELVGWSTGSPARAQGGRSGLGASRGAQPGPWGIRPLSEALGRRAALVCPHCSLYQWP